MYTELILLDLILSPKTISILPKTLSFLLLNKFILQYLIKRRGCNNANY